MRTVKIYGSSDDLIYFDHVDSGVYVDGKENGLCSDGEGGSGLEYGGDEGWFVMMFTEVVEDGDVIPHPFIIYIHVHYNNEGIWVVTPSRGSEEIPWPNYPIRITVNGYTMVCEIDVPANQHIHIKQLPD